MPSARQRKKRNEARATERAQEGAASPSPTLTQSTTQKRSATPAASNNPATATQNTVGQARSADLSVPLAPAMKYTPDDTQERHEGRKQHRIVTDSPPTTLTGDNAETIHNQGNPQHPEHNANDNETYALMDDTDKLLAQQLFHKYGMSAIPKQRAAKAMFMDILADKRKKYDTAVKKRTFRRQYRDKARATESYTKPPTMRGSAKGQEVRKINRYVDELKAEHKSILDALQQHQAKAH